MNQNKNIRSSRGERRPNRRKSYFVRNIILLLIIFSGLVLLLVGYSVFSKAKSTISDSYKSSGLKKTRSVHAILADQKPFSVLLMGTDTGELGRDNSSVRTDSIIFVVVNPKENKTLIMSLPRDQVTAIPNHSGSFPQKLNAAYEYGGVGATMETVQNWLNVPVDYYGVVNMGAMESIIDQLGGVKVVSPITFSYDPDTAHETGENYYTFTKNSESYKHYLNNKLVTESSVMDGATALAFSRMRYTDPLGDYGRQQRQRLVIQAVINKVISSPTTVLDSQFLQTLSKNFNTDLTFDDMMNVASKYSSAANHLVSDHAQGTTTLIDGQYFEYVENDERQRVTDELRTAMDLKKAKTGNPFGGTGVSTTDLNAYGFTSAGELLYGSTY
jgi:LCP family protein required for cell wall assembly